MPWNSPITWSPNQIVTATDLNAHLRDNMSYVHSGKPAVMIRGTQGDITSSSASPVDVDPTNLSITLSITTGRVLITGMMSLNSGSGHTMFIGATVDGSIHVWNQVYVTVGPITFTISALHTGLSIGSHTFRLHWQPSGLSTTFMRSAGVPCHFSVMEI